MKNAQANRVTNRKKIVFKEVFIFFLESVSIFCRADVVWELIPHLGSGDSEGSLTEQLSGAWHV